MVTLARIIPDEEQAVSSAAGIKLLVDLLQDSKSNETLALTADCIARLSHTRAGEYVITRFSQLEIHCSKFVGFSQDEGRERFRLSLYVNVYACM